MIRDDSIELCGNLESWQPRKSRSNCQGKLFETRSPTARKACITDAFVPVVHRSSSVQLEDVALEQRNPSQPVVGYRCDCRQTGCLIFAAQVSVVKTIVLGSASALNVGWLPATGTNRSKLTTGDISSIESWNICGYLIQMSNCKETGENFCYRYYYLES